MVRNDSILFDNYISGIIRIVSNKAGVFMKQLLIALSLVLFAGVAQADSLNVKVGYADYLVEGLDDSPRVEVSYELNKTFEPFDYPVRLGLELGIGGTSSNAHDTQVETPYTGKSMGRLTLLDYFITLKWYFTKDVHIGAGIDYLDPYFKENYSAEADFDDEIGAHVQAGWEFAKNWTIINKWGWGDIDAESGRDPQWAYGYKFTNGILEAQSNQHYWSLMIEKKF